MIGGIVMSQSNLEKQEAKLKDLNQKIKDAKNKIEQRLGKYRRLWRNCERKLNTSKMMISLAFLRILLKRF